MATGSLGTAMTDADFSSALGLALARRQTWSRDVALRGVESDQAAPFLQKYLQRLSGEHVQIELERPR